MEGNEAARFILQIAVMVLAAKVLGRIFQTWFRQPSVLGELLAGMLFGPYALGGIRLPAIGNLCPLGAPGAPEMQP